MEIVSRIHDIWVLSIVVVLMLAGCTTTRVEKLHLELEPLPPDAEIRVLHSKYSNQIGLYNSWWYEELYQSTDLPKATISRTSISLEELRTDELEGFDSLSEWKKKITDKSGRDWNSGNPGSGPGHVVVADLSCHCESSYESCIESIKKQARMLGANGVIIKGEEKFFYSTRGRTMTIDGNTKYLMGSYGSDTYIIATAVLIK